MRPKPQRSAKKRQPNPRRLTEEERKAVMEVVHSELYMDQPPTEIYADLLEQGKYLASVRTMYRVLAEAKENKERRNQRKPRSYAAPCLTATAPNQVWTWDITKLATFVAGIFLNLYVVLDLFSRYVVGWMLAERENSALAKQLFAEAISRYGIEPGRLVVHNDRGAPMTSIGFAELLGELGVDRSLSRPRVSNDNPFSESGFKTLKYQPDYPGRFVGTRDCRPWMHDFFHWYNNEHHHLGLKTFTPATVYFGKVENVAATRQSALNAAFRAHPERFINGPPTVHRPPTEVSINPATADQPVVTVKDILRAPDGSELLTSMSRPAKPTPAIIDLPGAAERIDTTTTTMLPS